MKLDAADAVEPVLGGALLIWATARLLREMLRQPPDSAKQL